MSAMSIFNLPTEFKADTQLVLYCIPLLGDIVRLATVVNTFQTLNLVPALSPEAVKSTRIDFAKWVIGSIVATTLFGAICPLTGLISAVIAVAAFFGTLTEQFAIINHKPLAGRATAL